LAWIPGAAPVPGAAGPVLLIRNILEYRTYVQSNGIRFVQHSTLTIGGLHAVFARARHHGVDWAGYVAGAGLRRGRNTGSGFRRTAALAAGRRRTLSVSGRSPPTATPWPMPWPPNAAHAPWRSTRFTERFTWFPPISVGRRRPRPSTLITARGAARYLYRSGVSKP